MAQINPIPKNKRLSDAEKARLTKEVLRAYGKGESIRSLAARSGRSYGAIHRILTDNDVALRTRGTNAARK